MSYTDEKTGVQGSIGEGVTIREELYTFEETQLFDGGMQVMLPQSFKDMPIELARLKFEKIPYGLQGGFKGYYRLTWGEPAYYNQFPPKKTNNQGPEYEYANSYSNKVPWEIPDFTCEEFVTMLNVGIAEGKLVFGVGVLQSSDPTKHQSYINAIEKYCRQNNISMNTVIDKNLAI